MKEQNNTKIKITPDQFDENILHMEIGGTSGNPENPEKVVIINTLEEGDITEANKNLDNAKAIEPLVIYSSEDDLIKAVDYRNHIGLLIKLNKIKRLQLEVNGKQLDIKSSPIKENNKDYVVQLKRDGNNWKENLHVQGTMSIRTGNKKMLGLIEEVDKMQIIKIPNNPLFIVNI